MCVDAGQECGSQRSSARLRRGNHADPDLAAGPGGVRRPRSRPVRAFSALRFGCRRHSPWGVALALVLSIPVRALSRFVPRGLAILATVSVLLGGLRTRARLPGTAPDRATRRPVLLAARDRLRPRSRLSGTAQVPGGERHPARYGERGALAYRPGPARARRGAGPAAAHGLDRLRVERVQPRRLALRGSLRRDLPAGRCPEGRGGVPEGGTPALYHRDAGKLWRALDVSLSRYLVRPRPDPRRPGRALGRSAVALGGLLPCFWGRGPRLRP